MKKLMICLFAFGMIAGAQEVRAEVSVQEFKTGQEFSGPRTGRREGIKFFENTVKRTNKFWKRNARKIRNKN